MSDLSFGNLIDLTLEDDIPCNNTLIPIKTECDTAQPSGSSKESLLFISPTWRKRDSLDNNPFDYVQKLANRLDDPFEKVEMEVCLKAQQALKPAEDIKLGNLLSLSDDDILDDQKPKTSILMAEDMSKSLELESPPVFLNEKLATDSVSGTETDSNPNSSAESSASAKLKKTQEFRKRLLKLSISNAAFSSPTARKQSLEFEDSMGTPISSGLIRAAEFGEHMLSAESPLKLVEDEDIMSEEPPPFLDSEKMFEADLEMLKIPILNEIPSPAVEEKIVTPKLDLNMNNNTQRETMEKALPNLEAIRAKLKAKKDEINNNHQQEISSLIQNLKGLISKGELVDKVKKQQASDLLESLRSALKPVDAEETLKPPDLLQVPVQPQTIKRQGTFDLDLKDNEVDINNEPLVQEMPNCMVSSSATYDGETNEEKQDLNLPEISPSSPEYPVFDNQYEEDNSNNENNYDNPLQPDVNDIMEQLSKLLINNSSDNPSNNHVNPTFIVVMNSNQLNHSNLNQHNQNMVDAKKRSSFVANYLENSVNDGSPDLTNFNPMTRRRSQSLSIHDKVKIVQLPLLPPTPRSIQKQKCTQLDDSPPVTTTPPSADRETPEFKTPARMIRRNSYSSGTPYTAQVGVRRTGLSSDSKISSQLRKSTALDTHHEGEQQQHAIVRPMPMPSNNLATFKPDLKKKPKHNTESIIKSTGPLKATIPVKKVAPMLKASPPTPDIKGNSSKTFHNTSLQGQSKISRVPVTPLATKKPTAGLGLGVGFPNACSTPAALTSPLKRTTGPVNKPRYSYMSATPNPKSSAAGSSSKASLKRRTITEFKAKSPLKPRVSSVAAAATAASAFPRASTGSSRLSTSAGARITKTPVKPASANTATIKPTSRLGTRASVGGSALTARNKENKRP